MAIITEEQLIKAREAAKRISKAYGVTELGARAAQILLDGINIETAHRQAETRVEEAREALQEVRAAVKDREGELMAEVVNATVTVDGKNGPEGKERYSNDSKRSTAHNAAKKADQELGALKAAEKTAKMALAAHEQAASQEKAKYNGMTRAYNLTQAQIYLAAACIRSLGGYESEAPDQAQQA